MAWGRRRAQHSRRSVETHDELEHDRGRDRDLVERMAEWHDRAELAVSVEDFAAAAAAQTLAVDIATVLTAHAPDDARAWHAVASTRYALIESNCRTGDFAGALESADACLAAYRRVAELTREPTGAGGGMVPVVADVRAWRAVALAGSGRITAGLLEADTAVSAYTRLGAQDWQSGHLPDLARVLSTVAPVRARYGEPDHAAGTADFAIRLYVENAARINQRRDAPRHARCLFEAAQIASDLHAAAGRTGLALSAANVGRQTGAARRIDGVGPLEHAYAGALARYTIRLTEDGKSDESEAFLTESCAIDPGAYARVAAEAYPFARARVEIPPLAEALRAAQAMLRGAELPELLDDLIADPWSLEPSLAATDRCPDDLAAEIAETLAAAAVRLLGEGDPHGLRLGLEANLVFAGACARDVSAMRHDFAAYGMLWAQALTMAAWRFHETGSAAMRWYAVDLAACLPDVLDRLAPQAASQPDITELVRVGTAVADSVLNAKSPE